MGTHALTIHGPLSRDDLPGLFRRVCTHLEAAGPGVLDCDVAGLPADAVALDALARLALAARRRRCAIRLSGASPELLALADLAGLGAALA